MANDARKYVRLYVERHGEKDGDALTTFGREQIVAAAQSHLMDVRFVRLLSSGMDRATQTVVRAMTAIGAYPDGAIPTIEIHPGLGFSGVDAPELPPFPWDAAAKQMTADGITSPTVFDVLKYWPPAWMLRERFTRTIYEIALSTWQRHGHLNVPSLNVFCGSHTPVAEMGVRDPRANPQLSPGDLMTYFFRVSPSGDRVELEGDQYLPCPLIKK